MSGISDINGFIDIKFAPRRNQNVQPDSSQEIQRLRKCLSECEETNASYAARIKSLEENLLKLLGTLTQATADYTNEIRDLKSRVSLLEVERGADLYAFPVDDVVSTSAMSLAPQIEEAKQRGCGEGGWS